KIQMKRSYKSIEIAAVVLALTAFLSFGIGIAASYSGPSTSNRSTKPIANAASASATHAPSVAAQRQPTLPDNRRSDLQVEAKTKPGPHRGTPRANIKAVAPGNDNCANATPIASCPFTDTVDTTETTDEVGEPQSDCTTQTNSVWYTYTAPGAGAVVTVDTCNSDFD